jgi:hypothetical protein
VKNKNPNSDTSISDKQKIDSSFSKKIVLDESFNNAQDAGSNQFLTELLYVSFAYKGILDLQVSNNKLSFTN